MKNGRASELWKAFGVTTPSSGDTTPCRMTGVTVHSHVRYKEIGPHVPRLPPAEEGKHGGAPDHASVNKGSNDPNW